MLADFMDYKNSLIGKALGNDKVDPGTMSFLEPGWWALHATVITTLFFLARRSNRL